VGSWGCSGEALHRHDKDSTSVLQLCPKPIVFVVGALFAKHNMMRPSKCVECEVCEQGSAKSWWFRMHVLLGVRRQMLFLIVNGVRNAEAEFDESDGPRAILDMNIFGDEFTQAAAWAKRYARKICSYVWGPRRTARVLKNIYSFPHVAIPGTGVQFEECEPDVVYLSMPVPQAVVDSGTNVVFADRIPGVFVNFVPLQVPDEIADKIVGFTVTNPWLDQDEDEDPWSINNQVGAAMQLCSEDKTFVEELTPGANKQNNKIHLVSENKADETFTTWGPSSMWLDPTPKAKCFSTVMDVDVGVNPELTGLEVIPGDTAPQLVGNEWGIPKECQGGWCNGTYQVIAGFCGYCLQASQTAAENTRGVAGVPKMSGVVHSLVTQAHNFPAPALRTLMLRARSVQRVQWRLFGRLSEGESFVLDPDEDMISQMQAELPQKPVPVPVAGSVSFAEQDAQQKANMITQQILTMAQASYNVPHPYVMAPTFSSLHETVYPQEMGCPLVETQGWPGSWANYGEQAVHGVQVGTGMPGPPARQATPQEIAELAAQANNAKRNDMAARARFRQRGQVNGSRGGAEVWEPWARVATPQEMTLVLGRANSAAGTGRGSAAGLQGANPQ
jgi:hypothetical protein